MAKPHSFPGAIVDVGKGEHSFNVWCVCASRSAGSPIPNANIQRRSANTQTLPLPARADPQTRYEKPPSSRVSQDSGHFTSRRTRRGLQGKKKNTCSILKRLRAHTDEAQTGGQPGRPVGRSDHFFLLLCLLTLINEPSHCRTSLLRTNCPVYCGTRGCKTNGPEPAFFAGAGR